MEMDIKGNKSKKGTASSGKTGLNNMRISKSRKGKEPGVQNDKRSLLACHTLCKSYMEFTRKKVNVTIGIKVMKFGRCLIGWEVTVTCR